MPSMKPIEKSLVLAIAGMLALPSLSLALPPLVEAGISAGGWSTQISGTTAASSGFVSRSASGTRASQGIFAQGQGSSSASFGVLRAYGQVHATGVNGGGLS